VALVFVFQLVKDSELLPLLLDGVQHIGTVETECVHEGLSLSGEEA
jgi:hypothetical protein